MNNICAVIRICDQVLIQVLLIDSDKNASKILPKYTSESIHPSIHPKNYQNTEGSFSKNETKQSGLLVSLTTQVLNFLKYIFDAASKKIGCSKVEGLSAELTKNSSSYLKKITQTAVCYIFNKISNIDLKTILSLSKTLTEYIWMVIIKILLPTLHETLIKLPPESLPSSINSFVSGFLLFYKVLQVLQIVK